MSTLTQPSNATKRFCALCKCQINDGERINWHHPKPKSEGGVETVEVHQFCHVKHHSSQGDFKNWGRKGGIKTASMMLWIFNLKYKGGPPDPLRWIPFGR
jgi:hypothetical protein